MRQLGRGVFAGAVLAACVTSSTAPPPVSPAPAPEPRPGAATTPPLMSPKLPAVPAMSEWKDPWPTSWTDPRVVTALAADCDFSPARPRQHEDIPPNVLQCAVGYAQTCAPDPCFSDACERTCTTSCTTCGAACASQCRACKAPCTDDSCRTACATTCAECREACTGAMDRCVTGDCSKVRVACEARVKRAFARGGCKARCATERRCEEACTSNAKDPDGPSDACFETCRHRAAPGYESCSAKCASLADEQASACSLGCVAEEPCSIMLCSLGLE